MKIRKTLFLVVASILSLPALAQINAYAKVTAISGTTLSLSNVNQSYASFTNGQQVIIMQMQDNVVGTNNTNTATYGNVSTIANAGTYEVATIASVAGLPGSITISGATSHTYNFGANSAVQIISFPKFGSPNYTTTAAITALPWDGNRGGVVAMQVAGTLTLAYSITADGLGFRGGSASANYEVNCEPTVYASNSSNYANKGEGIQVNATGFLYGRNALATGAGGGSDDNGGGGGGSNYTAGGQGGAGWTCSATPSGGFGGNDVSTYITSARMFMGGGGGGGQQNNSVGSSGVNGGGIILLQATTLVTSCTGSLSISASGLTAANSGNDGSGGAGAGGSIYMSVTNFNVSSSCPLTISSNGGNGGNVTDPNAHGGGGGGGQGVIVFPAAVPTTNITTATNSGTGGANSASGPNAGSGAGATNSGLLSNKGLMVLAAAMDDFNGRKAGSSVVLNWNELTLLAGTTFTVERSTDGQQYATIGTVDGGNALNTMQHYSFTDETPNPGQNYYRIQETDGQGNQAYTAVVTENFQQAATTTVNIYPNPATDHFTIAMPGVTNGVYALSLFDITGRQVVTSEGVANAGQININLAKKPTPGIYLIRINYAQQVVGSEIVIR
jgi:hypothetical protein